MDKLKLAFGVFLIVAVIYLGIQVVPAYYDNYEFQDAISQQALDSTYTPQTADDIKNSVYKTAQEIGVPVTEDQIAVTRTGTQANGSITIDVHYTVPITIPGYPYELQFNPTTQNHSMF